MAQQSNLYKYGVGLAEDVNVVSDSARDLGSVDVSEVGQTIIIDTEGEPRLGDVGVHNTVATDISAALDSTQASDALEVLATISQQLDTDVGEALNTQNNLDINIATTGVDTAADALNGDTEIVIHDPESQNHNAVTSFTHDVSTAMPSNAVPDGVEVLFQAAADNGQDVQVESINLPPGGVVSLQITNTDVVTTSGTGTINVLFET